MGYEERWDDIWREKRQVASGKLGLMLARDIIYRTVAGILRREIPDVRGKQILEAGSGTGLVTLELAGRGADVFLLDLSPEAVRFSRAAFSRAHTDETSVQASVLDLPFRANSFDVTWNGGVIEHFERDDQIKIVSEMLRVTKPDGKVIVIAPSSEARTYLRGKQYADRHGVWQPGYEVPISSLKDIATQVPGRLIREYRTGFIAELHFLKYYFARSRLLRRGWCGLVEILSLLLFPLNRLPGYLLVSVWKPQD